MGMNPEMRTVKHFVRLLTGSADDSYAARSGIRLKDRPAPLFQLLVLALLASRRDSIDAAVRAARGLFKSGLKSPRAVLESDRRTVVALLGETTATRLRALAQRVRDEFDGDLRNLGVRAGYDETLVAAEVQTFDGVDRTGANVFVREVQAVWTWVQRQADPWGFAPRRDDHRVH